MLQSDQNIGLKLHFHLPTSLPKTDHPEIFEFHSESHLVDILQILVLIAVIFELVLSSHAGCDKCGMSG